ncbi:MAG TPA: MFS transporter, partial [Bacillota bacterium]|nr:MFS transporter [Bacillota bacterium]
RYLDSFPVMGAVFGLAIAVLMLVTFGGTRERVNPPAEKPEGFFKNLHSIIKIREFRYMLGLFISVMAGIDLFMVMVIYLLKYVAGVAEEDTYILMAIPLVAAAAATPLWVKISERWGKRKVFMAAAAGMAPVFLCLLIIPERNIPWIVLLSVVLGGGISALMLLPYSMIPDVVEVDELASGRRREGSFYGFIIFAYKAASAAAVNMGALALGLFGYVESMGGAEFIGQPPRVITGIRLITGIGPAVLLVLAALFARALDLDQERFERIKTDLAARSGRNSSQ